MASSVDLTVSMQSCSLFNCCFLLKTQCKTQCNGIDNFKQKGKKEMISGSCSQMMHAIVKMAYQELTDKGDSNLT